MDKRRLPRHDMAQHKKSPRKHVTAGQPQRLHRIADLGELPRREWRPLEHSRAFAAFVRAVERAHELYVIPSHWREA